VARTKGVRALWKGLTPFATHLTLKYALRMGNNAFLQGAFKDIETVKLSHQARLVFAFRAGVLQALVIVTPLEVSLDFFFLDFVIGIIFALCEVFYSSFFGGVIFVQLESSYFWIEFFHNGYSMCTTFKLVDKSKPLRPPCIPFEGILNNLSLVWSNSMHAQIAIRRLFR